MKTRTLILLAATSLAFPSQAALRYGLGSAVAHHSADLINSAGNAQSSSQGDSVICGSHRTDKTGTVTFTAAPIDLVSDVTYLFPLGNLNPPGHTLPTDHMYFYYIPINAGLNVNPVTNTNPGHCSSGCDVYAIADGYLNEIMYGADSGSVANQLKITIVYTDTFASYFDHMSTLDPTILAQTGPLTPFGNTCAWVPVKAGQKIGTVGGVSGQLALDLGVTNLEVTQPFITPAHYGYSLHSDAPIKYFAEPLKSTLYSMVGRTTPDYLGSNELDGIFCYDLANTISGNWAAQGTDTDWGNPDAWTQELSIGYDPVYASQIRITFGGKYGSQSFGLLGDWPVQPGAMTPASVTVATGAYGYQIYGWDPSFGTINLADIRGLLMVQLLDNHTLKMEYFSGTSAGVTSLPFDSNAVLYTR